MADATLPLFDVHSGTTYIDVLTSLEGRHRLCTFPGCGRRHSSRGYCRAHVKQLRRGRPLTPVKTGPLAKCSFDGCGSDVEAKGLCTGHYQRRNQGLPLVPLQRWYGASATCSAPGCSRRPTNRELCAAHAQRRYKGPHRSLVSPNLETPLQPKGVQGTCQFAGCELRAVARHFCSGHYCQWSQGRPMAPLLRPSERCPFVRFDRKLALADSRARLTSAERDEARWYASLILGDPCVYCGAPAETVDHIRPAYAGGGPEWGNLAPACQPCNSSKNARSLLDALMFWTGDGD